MSADDGAREDFQERIGLRSDAEAGTAARALPPPAELTAVCGAGHVTLDWPKVPGALGYVVQRADRPQGPFTVLDHHGGDVLAVPGPPYVDTTGRCGETYWYRVGAMSATEVPPAATTEPVAGTAAPPAAAPPLVRLRADHDRRAGTLRRPWHMLGAERLSQLLDDERTAGHPVGSEFAEALRQAHDELGARTVRAHAILHDELAVYHGADGNVKVDFDRVDEVYDRVLALGYRPVVELSFMPTDLASDPAATVFDYRAIISPPVDWTRWEQLVGALTEHLVARYGVDEVRRWAFEVWNEPNLEVFWTASQEDYFQLYERAARAVKAVDPRLPVGGPATAQGGWIADFLDRVAETGAPLDFVTTHVYGTYPFDVRTVLEERGLHDVAVWWTEWGITPRHFAPVNDRVFSAPFVLHGMKAAQANADALAYWVVSDHFEELGRPPRLFHGGFGLLSVGNLRKARYWALVLAEQLGDERLDVDWEGDGGGGLVDAWVTVDEGGVVDVLAWNGTLDQSKAEGAPELERRLEVTLEGLPAPRYTVTVARIDEQHSNVASFPLVGDWPTSEEWGTLRAADRLHEERLPDLSPERGVASLSDELPMPGVIRLRLRPQW